jgi:16S rRNA (adenine1518-N6/adenine1519-N6)-dimethyltransferase
MEKIKPLKRFGQNYLTDNNILEKIVKEFAPAESDSIIEIGPGQGSLTKKLLEKTSSFTAIEIDTRVTEELKNKFPDLELINGDFLELSLQDIFKKRKQKLRVIGNIPYNLTSPIIFRLINNHEIIKDAVLMTQLEVARRMTASKGTKDYGILSVLIQFFSDVKLCFKVSPNVFYPKPKVYSALVHLHFKEISLDENEQQLFIKIVKAAFGKRRKTLKNSLSNSIFADVNFIDSGINLALRAEQLDINDFIKLAKFARDSHT